MPVAQTTVYLNADRTKVVAEDSPDAAFLLAREGTYIDEATAAQYDLTSDEPAVYDAVADHAAKHGGETPDEAARKRAAMLDGEPDPDGEPVEGERAGVKASKATANKAREGAPENK